MNIDYNLIARSYAANRSASPRILAHIQEEMQSRSRTKILEIGCGTADYLSALCQAWGSIGIGFDQSEGMLAEASKRNHIFELIQGDASVGLPFPSDAFDFTFSVDVIHYITDLRRYFKEAFRVLDQGGAILTVTDSPEDIRMRTMSHYFPESLDIELKRYPRIEILEDTMYKAGFTGIRTTHTRYEFILNESHLEKYAHKAFSSLRLISSECFTIGLERLSEDIRMGRGMGIEVYTYILGIKS